MLIQTRSSPGKFSTYLAITSFGIGTILLITHLCSRNNVDILITGFLYVLAAIIINGITMIYLLYHYLVNRLDREIIAIRILILLSNIPVTILYISIVFHKN